MGRLSKELNLEMTWIFDLDKVPKSGGAVTKKQLLNAGTWGHVTTPARLNFTLTKDPVLQINYPEGTYRSPGTVDGSMGGAQFYADPLSPKQRGLLEFSVYFPADFPFHLGGKLPGLYGSIPGSSDFSDCSGGSPANGTNCWSIRLMWRARGAGEIYTYLPSVNSEFLCSQPKTICSKDDYGMSLGRSAFTFKAGDWTDIGLHVQVNDLGQRNGFIQLFVNGDRALSYPSIAFRASTLKADQLLVEDVMFSTFFGGHTELYATPQDTFTQFKDMSLSLSDTITSSSSRVQSHWLLLWTVLLTYCFTV